MINTGTEWDSAKYESGSQKISSSTETLNEQLRSEKSSVYITWQLD
jgi:hypothetical protein